MPIAESPLKTGWQGFGEEPESVRFWPLTPEESAELDKIKINIEGKLELPLLIGDASMRDHLEMGSLWARNRDELARA